MSAHEAEVLAARVAAGADLLAAAAPGGCSVYMLSGDVLHVVDKTAAQITKSAGPIEVTVDSFPRTPRKVWLKINAVAFAVDD